MGAQRRGLKPPNVGLVVATQGWFGWSQPGTRRGPDADTKWRHRRRRGQPFEIEDLGDQDEAPTTGRVPVRLDLFSTGLELIKVPIAARGADDRGSGRGLSPLREGQRPLACRCDYDAIDTSHR